MICMCGTVILHIEVPLVSGELTSVPCTVL